MNNFCVLPFNSISIDALGNLRPCCNSYTSKFNFNIEHCSVNEFINNKDIISLRNNFLNDQKDSRCDRCWNIENTNGQSFRHVANNDQFYGLKSIIPINKNTTIQFEDIQYIDITLGNKCNLACRMCNAYSSSLLARQMTTLGMSDNLGNKGLIEFSRSSKDKILDVIEKSYNLNSLYMLGGEPLINDFNDEIVDFLISKNRAKNIKIHYSTNLQIDVEKHLDKWSNFKLVDLSISIDGSREIYEYVRWPGSWNKISKNLKKIYELKTDLNLFVNIASTVQNLNASNLFDMIDEIQMLTDDHIPFYFIPVSGAHQLEISPTDILISEKNKLSRYKDFYNRKSDLLKQFDNAIEKSKKLNESQVKLFFDNQQKFDSIRKQNLFETVPWFKILADNFKINRW